MRIRCIIFSLSIFLCTQNAQAFWIGAAVRGAKSVENELTESKPVASKPMASIPKSNSK